MSEQDKSHSAERQRVIDSLTPGELANALLEKTNKGEPGIHDIIIRLNQASTDVFYRRLTGGY